jgi:mannose-6-phosphate isomerase-like protein (cupin superfamily)
MDYSPENLKKMQENFLREGFVGPIPIFTSTQCELIIKHDRYGESLDPMDWEKGIAATDKFYYDIAIRPTILLILKSLLGENVILWGAKVIVQNAGQIHPWHTDIETSTPNGHCVSIWVGLENTNESSTLQIISRSHKLGKPIQQMAQERNYRRGEASSDLILGWAREQEPLAEIVHPIISEGEAIIFDGDIWHASFNNQTENYRTALLLQYSDTDTAIRIPDYKQLEWPFRFKSWPKPPTILISGKSTSTKNRLIPPPNKNNGSEKILGTHIQPLSLPLTEDKKKLWKPYYLFKGRTRNLEVMSCHVSVLSPGHSPHPPHAHLDEELLIVLEGDAELIISDSPDTKEPKIVHLQPGSFVYYPPYQHHTIRNTSAAPISYLMFKWRAPATESTKILPCKVFHYGKYLEHEATKAFSTQILFERSTPFLKKIHTHITTIQPGGGYAPHIDAHDVAIVMLSGTVETLGQIIKENGVIYYSAGELHGMKNIGNKPARYLVFEFHSPENLYLENEIAEIPLMSSLTNKIYIYTKILQIKAKNILRKTRMLLGRKKGLLGKFTKLLKNIKPLNR